MSRRPLATAAGARCFEDRNARRAGRADLRRVLDGGVGRPRDRPLGADRRPAGAERGQPRRHHPDRQREHAAARLRRIRVRTGHSQHQLRRQRAHDSPERHRDIRRGFADPPQPMFRVNGEPAIGLAIAMRDGGDILALGNNIEQAMDRSHRGPAARHHADPGRRPAAVRSSMRSAISRRRSGRRSPSSSRSASSASASAPAWSSRLSIPLTLAVVFPIMHSSGSTCSASRSAR